MYFFFSIMQTMFDDVSMCRFLYKDNVAQLCFQISLLPCYVIPLLTLQADPLFWSADLLLPCVLSTAGLQFFYLSAFIFLFLESLVLLNKLVDNVNLQFVESSWLIIVCGILPPLLYTGLTTLFLYQEIVTNYHTL